MEIVRRYIESYPTGLAAYIALECALMRRYIARGGTAEAFCEHLAPVYHRRFGRLLLEGDRSFLPPPSRPGRLGPVCRGGCPNGSVPRRAA